MALLVPLVLGGIAIAVMMVMSWHNARQKRLAAVQRPISGSRILIHDINDDRCTGCDACVAVCPTNVLDLISNKSRVVRFQDCIQCEQCMWACPTEALVMHPEGTEPPQLTVPELDGNYQTAVPGQYLIGEVAGKPLVKNAANLGRGVVEHMLQSGVRPGLHRRAEGSDSHSVTAVDVCIVGSGPGGLSAALTCMHHGLSYVVLEKEQIVASTVARYPKGKLIMAEPYDCRNLSMLPAFDSSKEQIIAVWEELIHHTGLNVKLGEAVEKVQRSSDGNFDIRTTVAAYRAQRVVLATGLRGKPRTLGVPGENHRNVFSLLEDPDDWRGMAVTVVGGGDSALEAAMALADAGAKVLLTYRGRGFSRAQNKNKQAIASYAAQRRIKVKFQTQVAEFSEDSVTLRFHDGTHKRYPNQAAFVLIGADPPVKWLEKLGVNFVQRPHSYQLGPTDQFVAQYAPRAVPCPEDAAGAASLVRGETVRPRSQPADRRGRTPFPKIIESGRKWIQSASQIFTSARDIDGPMPLSEFAARQRKHSGHGRRDALDASERTRVLRMLRDDGARLADEDSRMYAIEEPSGLELGYNEPSPAPEMVDQSSPFSKSSPPPMHLDPNELRIEAKQQSRPVDTPREAIIVGLAKAKQGSGSRRRPSPPPVKRDPGFHQAPTHLHDLEAIEGRRPPNGHNGHNGHAKVAQDDPTAFVRRPAPPPPQRYAADEFEEATRAVDIDPNAIMAAVERPNAPASVVLEDDATEFMDMSRLPDIPPPRPASRPKFRPAHTISDVDFDFDE